MSLFRDSEDLKPSRNGVGIGQEKKRREILERQNFPRPRSHKGAPTYVLQNV